MILSTVTIKKGHYAAESSPRETIFSVPNYQHYVNEAPKPSLAQGDGAP